MAGSDPQDPEKDARKAIFTGDDLPPEDAIPPAGTPVSPGWDAGDGSGYVYGAAPSAPLRLGLDDGEERLPWLESADDIDPDESFDGGRVIGFVLLGLVALAMIVGAVWFASHRGPGQADGSLIRAEPGPYKVAPEDPGGKQFAGTGDTSYAVAQGETRSGTIAGEPSVAQPGFSAAVVPVPTVSPPAPKASASATASVAAAATDGGSGGGGVGVQIGAYSTAADAEKGWSALAGRHEALAKVKHRVIEGQADFGRVFRLQAVAGDLAAAHTLCASLKASGQGCQVKK